jgi:hypothetical protein
MHGLAAPQGQTCQGGPGETRAGQAQRAGARRPAERVRLCFRCPPGRRRSPYQPRSGSVETWPRDFVFIRACQTRPCTAKVSQAGDSLFTPVLYKTGLDWLVAGDLARTGRLLVMGSNFATPRHLN